MRRRIEEEVEPASKRKRVTKELENKRHILEPKLSLINLRTGEGQVSTAFEGTFYYNILVYNLNEMLVHVLVYRHFSTYFSTTVPFPSMHFVKFDFSFLLRFANTFRPDKTNDVMLLAQSGCI